MKVPGRPQLFLSYARDDHDLALALREDLIDRGFEIFLDTEGLLAGEDFVSTGRPQSTVANSLRKQYASS